MRAGADARIIPIAPIDQVMPRFRAGFGMVRDFIGRHARRIAQLLRCFIHIGGQIVFGQAAQPAPRIPVPERGARFDRQLVQGQVIDRHAQRLAQLRAPGRHGLILPRIDQVETDAIEILPCDIKGLAGFGGAVNAPQPPQVGIVQRLDAHRHARDARLGIAAKPSRLHRPGIGLERDFQIVRHRPAVSHPLQNAVHDRRIHQARRAAAKENRGQHPALQGLGVSVDFAQVGPQPAGLVDFAADMAVEIAIGALGLAKRPVDIEAEAPLLPIFRQNSLSSAWRRRRPDG